MVISAKSWSCRKWIDDAGYADLVALCQFVPGPASSQVGFALGLLRGGPLGAFAAWAAFTLPSAPALVLFALGAAAFEGPVGAGLLHGLKIVAVAVVAQAVWGMARTLAPDRERASIAVAAVLIVIFAAGSVGQIAAIVIGGLAGLFLCRGGPAPTVGHLTFAVPKRVGIISLALFGKHEKVGGAVRSGLAWLPCLTRAHLLSTGNGKDSRQILTHGRLQLSDA